MHRLTLLVTLLTLAPIALAETLGTAFTYQGQLQENGKPVTGAYDLEYRLFDASVDGVQVGNTVVHNDVTVTDGLFTDILDFGVAPFSGDKRWVQIAINGAPLSPRQPLTAAPYALFATAPWAPSGFDLSYTAGNVGVGTSSPTARLHIAGPVKLDGASTFQFGAGIAGQETNAGKIGYRTFSLDSLDIVGAGTSASNRKIRFYSEGGASFDGGATIAGNLTLGKVIQNGTSLQQIVTTSDLGLYSVNEGQWMRIVSNDAPIQFFTSLVSGIQGSPSANSMVMSISNSGRVGIGTGSPTYKLDVLSNEFATRFSDGTRSLVSYIGNAAGVDGAFWGTLTNHALTLQTNNTPRLTVMTDGKVGIGTTSPTQMLDVNGWVKCKAVQIIGGADLAEPFDVAESQSRPGMVVCIDAKQTGKLRLSEKEYDTTVAGVISGANGVSPGLTLTQEDRCEADGSHLVALTGRVWAYADADIGGAIQPGDLLTTSQTPGHAMKATDRERRSGATLGKAMSSLQSGKGLVLVLVNLQ